MSSFNLLVVLGATASGKTKLAVELARQFNGEVISADSRQVYRGLDLGSGKDLAEYQEIPYHLIDIVDPGYEYNIFDFQGHFVEAFEDINQRNKLAILAGGSALYVDAILKGYRLIEVPENPALRAKLAPQSHQSLVEKLQQLKPQLHNTTDLIERERLVRAIEIAQGEQAANAKLPPFPEIKPFIFAIDWPREVLRQRITSRLKERLEQGLIEEVEQLHQQGVAWQTLEFYGLEYRFIAQYLQGKISKNDMFQKLNSAIHQFAKKQDTWLRRLERNGFTINHLTGEQANLPQALAAITNAHR
ncbi:tRNA (adenosine(37)-N6)-dimethylallyltransferase MiaA [Thalassotalea sp. PLHSN55]|uniref:tRNA (adenosine(37)-N6)-dimethylallyltransferase MiaA n=1 Tax=Thalassotalea sp. PLHSN55 TaxID=3435888 RepID=UPI003F87DBC2